MPLAQHRGGESSASESSVPAELVEPNVPANIVVAEGLTPPADNTNVAEENDNQYKPGNGFSM